MNQLINPSCHVSLHAVSRPAHGRVFSETSQPIEPFDRLIVNHVQRPGLCRTLTICSAASRTAARPSLMKTFRPEGQRKKLVFSPGHRGFVKSRAISVRLLGRHLDCATPWRHGAHWFWAGCKTRCCPPFLPPLTFPFAAPSAASPAAKAPSSSCPPVAAPPF